MKSAEVPASFIGGIDTIYESDIDDETSGNEPSVVLERRRISHTAAEQRRRNAIKKGYEELRDLVYPKNGTGSMNRISKTCILDKTVSEVEKHDKELEQKKKDIERLEKSLATLRILNSFYEERAKETAPENSPTQPISDELKFHIFQSFSDLLFTSFDSRVSLAPFTDLAEQVLLWLEDTCDQRFLSKLMDSVVASVLPATNDDSSGIRSSGSRSFCPDSLLPRTQVSAGVSTEGPESVHPDDWIPPNSITDNAGISSLPERNYMIEPNIQPAIDFDQAQSLNTNSASLAITPELDSVLKGPPRNSAVNYSNYKRNSLPQNLAIVLRAPPPPEQIVDSDVSENKRDYNFSSSHSTLATPSCGSSMGEQILPPSNFAPEVPAVLFAPANGNVGLSYELAVSTNQYKPFF